MIAGTDFRLADIDEAWPRYAERALRSRAEPEHLEWVREQCRRKDALCLECEDGIVVFTLVVCQNGTRAKVLLAAGNPGALLKRAAEFDAVVSDLGANEVSFRTDRPRAWRRVLGRRWYSDGERFWKAS